jgi:hypothetical protein
MSNYEDPKYVHAPDCRCETCEAPRERGRAAAQAGHDTEAAAGLRLRELVAAALARGVWDLADGPAEPFTQAARARRTAHALIDGGRQSPYRDINVWLAWNFTPDAAAAVRAAATVAGVERRGPLNRIEEINVPVDHGYPGIWWSLPISGVPNDRAAALAAEVVQIAAGCKPD